MARIVLGAECVLFIDYLPHGQTITREYRFDVLDRLNAVSIAKIKKNKNAWKGHKRCAALT